MKFWAGFIVSPFFSLTCFAQNSVVKPAKPKIVYGVASFYSRSLEGSETATGETFSHNNLTAASNRFPLHTWVKVTNLRNGKTIIVRINDRMAKSMDDRGRVIDLSRIGAAQLGFLNRGLTRVKVEEVPAPPDS